MALYTIEWKRSAYKELLALPKKEQKSIFARVEQLRVSPLRKALSMTGEEICPDSKEGKPNYTWLYSKVFLTKLFGAKIKPGAELAFRRGLKGKTQAKRREKTEICRKYLPNTYQRL